MEVMEEGNLLDRVRILLQRDLDYYKQHQSILQETLCSGVVGGLLDFPRYASFAAIKLVTWWEAQFKNAYQKSSGLSGTASEINDEGDRGCGGVVVNLAPNEFLKLVEETASQLLEHLHILSQEALDHADLTVLTGTLGAAALVKNTLWCYNEHLDLKGGSCLRVSYKQYREMSEALAERLLDLHCRLLSLYVLQDADSLSWDHPHPFFEGERGSFVIQMWWLYMQGTRNDLWNVVPPRTAQRILAGMLNETLTILASRYSQAEPSPARVSLLLTDIGNLLMCVNEILPSICSDAFDFLGFSESKILRDIHGKCHQLLICLILRGCPLSSLYKVFKNGFENVSAFKTAATSIAPWMIFINPELLRLTSFAGRIISDDYAIELELKVLACQPQANYPLLLRVLTMRDYKVSYLLLKKNSAMFSDGEEKSVGKSKNEQSELKCGGFLCSESRDCKISSGSSRAIISALSFVLMNVCNADDLSKLLIPAFELMEPNWANCLDRHQVWNLNRPPWLSAFTSQLKAPLMALAKTAIDAAESNAAVHKCVALILEGLVKLSDVLPSQIFKVAGVLQENVPADVKPAGNSVLLQLLISVVYDVLVGSKNDVATAIAEALCRAKIPSAIVERLEEESKELMDDGESVLVSDVTVSRILFTRFGRTAMKSRRDAEIAVEHKSGKALISLGNKMGILHDCVLENLEWLVSDLIPGRPTLKVHNRLLHIMFHIGSKPFDGILSGEWKPDYLKILERPLSLSRETVWLHLSKRPEFSDPSNLSKHDKTVVETISYLFISD